MFLLNYDNNSMINKVLKYGLVVALLVAAGAVYFLSGRSRAVPNQPGKCTTIRFEQDTLRLGQYTNTGDVPLLIKNVQTTCGCTEATWEKSPLLPGQSGEIKVEFTGESEGRFVKTIYVVCNIWKKVYPLLVIGDVVKE